MANNMIIIDGNSLLTTHFYGSLPMELRNEKDVEKGNELAKSLLKMAHGRYVSCVESVLAEILNLVSNYRCDYAAVVFDKSSKTTFRKKMYDDYKGNRSQKLFALKDQVGVLHDVLKLIGIQSYWSDTYEADDLAGSLITKFKSKVNTVYFVTKDHDWLQLIDRNVKGILLYPTEAAAIDARGDYCDIPENNTLDRKQLVRAYGKQVVLDAEACHGIEGVYPRFIPDKKGLAGDNSDNIPGAPGIGPVAAVALIQAFRTVENIYSSLDAASKVSNGADAFFKQLKPFGLKRNPYNTLIGTENSALLSKELATIKTDIDFPAGLARLKVSYKPDMIKKVIDFYELYEFDEYCNRHGIIQDMSASYDFD